MIHLHLRIKKAEYEQALFVIKTAISVIESLRDADVKVVENAFKFDQMEFNIPEGASSKAINYKYSAGQGDADIAPTLAPDVMLTIDLWVPEDEIPGFREGLITCRIGEISVDMQIWQGRIQPVTFIDRTEDGWRERDNKITATEGVKKLNDMMLVIADKLIHVMDSSQVESVQIRSLRIVNGFISRGVFDPSQLPDETKEMLMAGQELFGCT